MDKSALFGRLAEGHAARITVVTPNARLAQALQADFDCHQENKAAWEAADILPFGAFVQRLYEDALYSDLPALPMLLTASQEDALWEQIVVRAGLLAVRETARECANAWRLAHEWRIRPGAGAGNEDAAAFAAWSDAYRRRTSADVDAARLPDLVAGSVLNEPNNLGLKKPRLLVAYAFDILTPQTREFFETCAAHGIEVQACQPDKVESSSIRASFPSAKKELEAAASWARATLENLGQAPISPRIGIVVPDLQQRRKEVVRVFSRVMRPGFNLPGAAAAGMPFNVSIGIPLVQYPVVALALSLLEFSQGEITFERASALIRSPFIDGAERELAARARLDTKLRRRLDARVSLPKLIAHVDGCPQLRELLERVFQYARAHGAASQPPSAWARHFSALLDAAGFPGERTPDSAEFQARAKWHEALGEFARLERVSAPMPFMQAVGKLRGLCADTLFQPESADAPIQVLGILESVGLEFDHLWVMGLTDEKWPLRAAPHPFLPIALQKQAGLPQASAESSLALDRRITEGWRGAAAEAVFSHFTKEDDKDLAPSPLIAQIAEATPPSPAFPRFRDEVFALKSIASLADAQAPALAAKSVRGGTRVLADQAACPFRAFARWRLHAAGLETPESGLDAAQRGQLLHALMKHLWDFLKSSAALQQDLKPAIERAADLAVKELRLEGRFAAIERARLARLAAEWLEVEKRRTPFEVIATEKQVAFSLAEVEFTGRIDRMDRLWGGEHALIDYKTSRSLSPKQWEPPRPDDPQMPLYAVTAKEDVAAVAFAKLRPGDMKFMGFSKEDKAIPGVKPAKAWKPLLRMWREEAESLASGFARGDALVDPKRGLQTCRYCDLQTLCRVYEKQNVLAEEEPEQGAVE